MLPVIDSGSAGGAACAVASTRAISTLWVPTSRASMSSQSKATSASLQCGAPVESTDQRPAAKRSAIGTWPTPANSCDRSCRAAGRQLMHSTPFALMMSWAALRRLTQATRVAGVSLTPDTAEQVRPAMPAGPSVAMTETAVVEARQRRAKFGGRDRLGGRAARPGARVRQ